VHSEHVNWNWKYTMPLGGVGEGRAKRGKRGGIGTESLLKLEAGNRETRRKARNFPSVLGRQIHGIDITTQSVKNRDMNLVSSTVLNVYLDRDILGIHLLSTSKSQAYNIG
jgi:hypothetical protein